MTEYLRERGGAGGRRLRRKEEGWKERKGERKDEEVEGEEQEEREGHPTASNDCIP